VNNYQILDNFLSKEDFLKLKNLLLSHDFPWYFNSHKVSHQYSSSPNEYNFQFTHLFYKHYTPQSSFVETINPLIKKINPKAIVAIKANLTPITTEKIIYGYHTDYEFKGKTGIFYVNNNNGTTLLKDVAEIESIENRLVIFDSKILHTGTSCTNEQVRCVINLNFYAD
jgi:hypothetical protein